MTNKIIYSIMLMWYLLNANTTFAYTRQDTLRGNNGNGRNWWDVQFYNLNVDFDTLNKTINADNEIIFTVTGSPHDSLQIDLQYPMILDSAMIEALIINSDAELNLKLNKLSFEKEGNVWWIKLPSSSTNILSNSKYKLTLYYHGQPVVAKRPPWDGGFIWTTDSTGKSWVAVACQGLGASSWWPCKDYQGDEPDNGMTLNFTYPKGLYVVSNGRIAEDTYTYYDSVARDERQGITWKVSNPINSYNATFYMGDYTHWHDTMMGEKDKLDIDFYVLRCNEAKARTHFAITKQMLHCFEYWMGPYPFYEDGYKLVDAPYLGMEHQGAVAYGNEYKMGYKGSDRSNTGVGLLFDFIIVHESGHEWFGNNITAKDIADNWLHEGFTTYTETLFAECAFGKEKAFQYAIGEWANIRNDKPVIGDYNVNDDGSGDKYDKGAAVVHMIRTMMSNDNKFRLLLRNLNRDFYHKTVTSTEVEQYISTYSGLDLKAFFDQYLRTNKIPELNWYIQKKQLYFRFAEAVPGFTLPIIVKTGRKEELIHPTTEWQNIEWKRGGYNLSFSKDYLITSKP